MADGGDNDKVHDAQNEDGVQIGNVHDMEGGGDNDMAGGGDNDKLHDAQNEDTDQTKEPKTKVQLKRKLEAGTLHRQNVKRKLFSEPDCTERSATSDIVLHLLGLTTEVQEFLKYRKLAKEMPNESSFHHKYDKAKAVIEKRILKKHRELKDKVLETNDPNLKTLQQKAEQLMDHWGTCKATIYKYTN